MIYGLTSFVLPLGIGSVFSDIGNFITSIPEKIGSAIINAITTLVGKGLYYLIVKGLLSIVNIFYRLFEVFAGLRSVDYDGTKSPLLNVFFNNNLITNIYWGMACIGMAMMFAFALIAVIRKIFDIEDKQQRPLSNILKNCFKSIFVTLVLSLCISGVLNGTNVLMQSISYLFDNANAIGQTSTVVYTESQFATMSRVLNTIGNFSLNPSYDSRFNINSCYNEIRADLYELQTEGLFDGHYETVDEGGDPVSNWMTLLQQIVEAADLSRDIQMDVYYESISDAIISAMKTLQNNPNLNALRSYSFPTYTLSSEVGIDKAIFLMGTSHAARSSKYNENASFTDAVRGPFYSGEKNMYDIDEVNSSFNIKVGAIDYVLIAIFGFLTLKSLFECIMLCAGRIFQMTALYLVAPPFIATMPWDDGEKFKQWVQAFIVQCFGVFGTIIPMRLLITLIPIILSDKLTLFPDSQFLNLISKVLLMLAGIFAVESFGQIFSGILAGSGGMASAGANARMGMAANRMFSAGTALAGGVAATGLKVGGNAAKGVLSGISTVTGLTTVGRKINTSLNNAGAAIERGWESMKENGGLIGALRNLPSSNGKIGGSDAGPSAPKSDTPVGNGKLGGADPGPSGK